MCLQWYLRFELLSIFRIFLLFHLEVLTLLHSDVNTGGLDRCLWLLLTMGGGYNIDLRYPFSLFGRAIVLQKDPLSYWVWILLSQLKFDLKLRLRHFFNDQLISLRIECCKIRQIWFVTWLPHLWVCLNSIFRKFKHRLRRLQLILVVKPLTLRDR